MFDGYWKRRAERAEAKLAQAQTTIETAKETIDGINTRLEDRAALISIVRDGRRIRFNFMRNGKLIPVQVMGTWDDDVDGWKRELLNG